jgi:hypothetical protein
VKAQPLGASAPTAVMPAGVIALLGASLRSFFPRYGSGRVKTLDLYGLDDGGAECVVTLQGVSLWSSDYTWSCFFVFGGKFWFSVFFCYL